jgi:TonB family protein
MFHSRLTANTNQSRLVVAIFLAVVAHTGFMAFEFKTKPLYVPEISLPRSVSVLLAQKQFSEPETSEKQTTEETVAKEDRTVTEFKNVLFGAPGSLPKIQNTPLRSYVKAIDVEKSESLTFTELIKVEEADSFSESEPEAIGDAQKSNALSEIKSNEEENTVLTPGTLQMAYPRYQLNDPPAYPRLARKREQQGTVVLQVLVNKTGRVADMRIESSSNYAMLDRAAQNAVRQWIFEPGRKGDLPIEMWVRVPVSFELRGK